MGLRSLGCRVESSWIVDRMGVAMHVQGESTCQVDLGTLANRISTLLPSTAGLYIVSLKWIEYGFGYSVIGSPYTPYSIYLRGTRPKSLPILSIYLV